MNHIKSLREQLGALISHVADEANISDHNIADKTRATIKEVKSWRRGELVPTLQEWQRLRAVFPRLTSNTYRTLYEGAAAEQRAIEEARDEKRADEPSAEQNLDAAVRMVVDAVPGLRSLTIDVADDGSVSANYRTREVRVIEDTGTIRLNKETK